MAQSIDFSHSLNVSELSSDGRDYKLVADQVVFDEVKERFDIVDITMFEALITIQDQGKHNGVWVTGHIKAALTQKCIVSLEDVHEDIDEAFELLLVNEATVERFDNDEAYLDPEIPDYDLLEGDTLSPGEVAIQTLSILMNPYPRKDGAEIDLGNASGISLNEEEIKRPNPFAVLGELGDDNKKS
ncbi:DUF177 domain-containing protein [Kordiimonas sp. SCSIO 12610]|uniref:YceD family protein n=1 Tax=Kordiimonas sp. SCSIO 12610 TaxID=2829597 RepID=UPI00210A88D3|nr:DUF177 domain-containing protein [Kordiimonas sp. SCSIO 12610]UTW54113.1 DUF177 domain-containing protein [Kordiimonas sp. SCSIO 12610]